MHVEIDVHHSYAVMAIDDLVDHISTTQLITYAKQVEERAGRFPILVLDVARVTLSFPPQDGHLVLRRQASSSMKAASWTTLRHSYIGTTPP
ncbi:hypothetical protein AB0J63_01435 [Streptosporangium canum]|uniref:hypothetical protein n=1 Tax=Streptosporangium canum TaxID=324952 RepID=UPI00342707C3